MAAIGGARAGDDIVVTAQGSDVVVPPPSHRQNAVAAIGEGRQGRANDVSGDVGQHLELLRLVDACYQSGVISQVPPTPNKHMFPTEAPNLSAFLMLSPMQAPSQLPSSLYIISGRPIAGRSHAA